MSATPATEPKTARLRWLSRVVATLTAVAGIGIVGAGQAMAVAGTITVGSVYSDNAPDHSEGVNYNTWAGSGTGGPQIATFTDSTACPTTCQPASDYTAQIQWGDGTAFSNCPADCTITFVSTAGTAGTYKITASHAFVDEKNGITGTGTGFTVQVTVHDTDGDPNGIGDNSANGGIWVVDQCLSFPNGTCPSTSQPTMSFNASVGVAFTNKLIGSFQDANQLAVGSDTSEYTININWGDGIANTGTFAVDTANCGSTPGVATGSGCPVNVFGSHTYSTTGTKPVTVTVIDGLSPKKLTIHISAIVSSGPACSGVTVTPVPTSPQQSGTVITFNAVAATCGNPEYLFYVQATGGKWILGRGYGSGTYVWNTAGNGVTTYNIDVWAREKNSGVSYQAFQLVMNYSLTTPLACTAGTINAAPPSPQASGTTITFTGGASTCSQPVFLFYVQATGGKWLLGRTWGFGPYLWKTTGNGKTTYNIDVWIRQNGSPSPHEVFAVATYVLT
jgi:hypothetical protein